MQEGRVQKGNINGMPTNPSPKDFRPSPPGENKERVKYRVVVIHGSQHMGVEYIQGCIDSQGRKHLCIFFMGDKVDLEIGDVIEIDSKGNVSKDGVMISGGPKRHILELTMIEQRKDELWVAKTEQERNELVSRRIERKDELSNQKEGEMTKMAMLAFEKVQGIVGVIEIERASNPHRDKWVFAQYEWISKQQECCVHGIRLRYRCHLCREMEQEVSMKEGRRAYVDGKAIEDCPYGVSAYEVSYHAWRLGWDTAVMEKNDQHRAGSP